MGSLAWTVRDKEKLNWKRRILKVHVKYTCRGRSHAPAESSIIIPMLGLLGDSVGEELGSVNPKSVVT